MWNKLNWICLTFLLFSVSVNADWSAKETPTMYGTTEEICVSKLIEKIPLETHSMKGLKIVTNSLTKDSAATDQNNLHFTFKMNQPADTPPTTAVAPKKDETKKEGADAGVTLMGEALIFSEKVLYDPTSEKLGKSVKCGLAKRGAFFSDRKQVEALEKQEGHAYQKTTVFSLKSDEGDEALSLFAAQTSEEKSAAPKNEAVAESPKATESASAPTEARAPATVEAQVAPPTTASTTVEAPAPPTEGVTVPETEATDSVEVK